MAISHDRILLVEHDPAISDLIGRQALQSAGYHVQVVGDATAAIPKVKSYQPNVVILDLNLPGLSGKDLLVALNAQTGDVPIILIARKGMEGDVIQGFRLGASDYLLWPSRDTEVVSVIERVLRQVHERQERERLSLQLQQTNQELQARIRELTTIFNLGKAVTSITDQRTLFNKIIDGACRIANAELGWLTIREDSGNNFVLVAQRGLPQTMLPRMEQAWDDGISSLVAMSGESLSIHGNPLKRFKVYSLGQSALIVPVKVKRQTIGIMIVMRSADRQFSENEQHLLEAVADYASISLVNSRLFRALEERAHSLQQAAENIQANEKSRGETLEALVQELWNPLNLAGQNLSRLLEGHSGKLAADQREALSEIMDRIQLVGKVSELISTASQTPASRPGSAEVNEVLRQVADRYQPAAQQTGINLSCDFPQERIMVRGEPVLIAQVVDGLLSNSMKFCPPGSSVLLKVEKTDQHHAHILIRDNGIGISKKDLGRLFERSVQKIEPANRPPCGEGIPLVLVKHLIDTIGGNIWVESQPGQGSSFHFTLMSPR